MPIQILSQQLANQIAAGEVIERASSVVKELMENAIDSGAESIQLEIENSGRSLIRIIDNGCGIPGKELSLAVSRHATSKLTTLEDLHRIDSLGFRGEALASISSIARLKIKSKSQDESTGWEIDTGDDSDFANYQAQVIPSAIKQGTIVEVRDLFFNTPARRKFLRTDKTEFRYIEQVFRNIALSHPQISFSLSHNKKTVKKVAAAEKNSHSIKRLEKLTGSDFVKHAIVVEHQSASNNPSAMMQISGWIAGPEYTRSSTDQQFFYINGRAVKDKLLSHALRQAFQQSFAVEEYPAYVLFLQLDPESLDVNVHPTKHEVRFQQSRMIHDFIVSALMQALSPSLDLNKTDVKVTEQYNNENSHALGNISHYQVKDDPAEPLYGGNRFSGSSTSYNNAASFQPPPSPLNHSLIEQSITECSNSDLNLTEAEKKLADTSFLKILDGRYLMMESDTGVHIIHSLALMSKINELQLQEAVEADLLLIPVKLQFKTEVINQLIHYEVLMNQSGIEFSLLGENSLMVRKLPKLPFKLDPEKALKSLLLLLKTNHELSSEMINTTIASAIEYSILNEKATFQKIISYALRNDSGTDQAIKHLNENELADFFTRLKS